MMFYGDFVLLCDFGKNWSVGKCMYNHMIHLSHMNIQ